MVGVTIVGDVPKTASPEPVSSLRTPANCAEVVAPKILRLFVTVPGNVNVPGIDRVQVPEVVIAQVPVAVIWPAVPKIVTVVTVPVPAPPPVMSAHILCSQLYR